MHHDLIPGAPLTHAQKLLFEAFPGLHVFGRPSGASPTGEATYAGAIVRAPDNAVWIATQLFQQLGLAWSERRRAAPAWRALATMTAAGRGATAPLTVPDLLPWVPGFLTHYQRDFVHRFAGADAAYLGWAPGGGKSAAAIVWSLLGGGLTVIVTRGGARRTLADEVRKFTSTTPVVVEGEDAAQAVRLASAKLPRAGWPAMSVERAVALLSPRFVVAGWESLPAHVEALMKLRPTTIVWDEAHRGSSRARWETAPLTIGTGLDAQAQRDLWLDQQREARERGGFVKENSLAGVTTRVMVVPKENVAAAANKLTRAAHRRCAASATPVMDRLRNAWAQLDLVDPGGWGGYRAFAERYCSATVTPYGGLDDTGASNVEELRARVAVLMHHVPKEVTHAALPGKVRQVYYLGPESLAKSTLTVAELKAAARAGPMALVEARLCEAASRKRPWIVENAVEWVTGGKKVTVFTGRRLDVELLAKALRRELGEKEADRWPVFTGMGGDDLQAVADAYAAHEGGCALVGTGQAMGESLNGLQCTEEYVAAMLPWRPGEIDQREGRHTRLGQTKRVRMHYPIAEGTFDERVVTRLLPKLAQVSVLGDVREATGLANDLEGEDDVAGLLELLRGDALLD